jgi:hypothetical protein
VQSTGDTGMVIKFENDVVDRFNQAVQETFPEGVVDMKFCVNERGTTADVMEQAIAALQQYRNGEAIPYTDY